MKNRMNAQKKPVSSEAVQASVMVMKDREKGRKYILEEEMG